MITESEIRDRYFDYVQRRITLNEFEDWLVQHSWNMHLDSAPAAQHLVSQIELRFAEYSADHLTDKGLERELDGLLALPVTVFMDSGESLEIRVTSDVATTGSQDFRVALLPN